jgi:hypothetical protein
MVAALIHTERTESRTDMKLKGAFRDYMNGPKN